MSASSGNNAAWIPAFAGMTARSSSPLFAATVLKIQHTHRSLVKLLRVPD